MLFRTLPIVLAVACVTALLMMYEHMQVPTTAQVHHLSLSLTGSTTPVETIELEAKLGDSVQLTLLSNTATTVVLHGFELQWELEANRPQERRITLHLSGRFTLEQSNNATPLAMITVHPS